MIRKLQRKFVLAAMLSLFIVFAALITVINVLNYRSVITEANMRAAFGVETVIGEIETPHNVYPDVLAVDTVSEENT